VRQVFLAFRTLVIGFFVISAAHVPEAEFFREIGRLVASLVNLGIFGNQREPEDRP
jgi:hypothetical protein